LSQFSRRARWLNRLFPASVAPTTTDPAIRSDDVSLVQPYDGSGWGVPNLEDWFFGPFLSPVGITGDTELVAVPEDSVFRVFSISAFTVIAAVAQVQPVVSQLQGVGGVNLYDQLATRTVVAGPTTFASRAIVLAPGSFLRGSHFLGNGTTQLSWSVYGCMVPTGTVFYC